MSKSAEFINSDDESTLEFETPPGFKKLVENVESKRSGEETWLIQIPASLDISKLSKLQSKGFKVGGRAFNVKETGKKDSGDLRLISKGKLSKQTFDRVLQVSESAVLPEIDLDKAIIPKPIVKQKENLYMRYYPTGYSADAEEVKKHTVAKPVKPAAKEEVKQDKKKDKKDKSKKRKKDEDGDKDKKDKKKKKRKEDKN